MKVSMQGLADLAKGYASQFSASSLNEIADNAELMAKSLRAYAKESLPIRELVESEAWNAADDFSQLAAYCRAIVSRQS